MAFPFSFRNSFFAAGPALLALGLGGFTGCQLVSPAPAGSVPGDEIIVAGKRIHTGTRVVTWLQPGGYNAYLGGTKPSPRTPPPGAKVKPVASGEPDLAALRGMVDQFVLHYDGCGLSRVCFERLRDRGLSVHFLLDLDGTIYQTLELRERAAHATIANDRSIGIEIANIGAYEPAEADVLNDWYARDADGRTAIRLPKRAGPPAFLAQGYLGRPARPGIVRGVLQEKELAQYDFTPEQYAALIKLTATLCTVFPRIKADYPHDASGRLITRKLPDATWAAYQGILGHYHVQANKVDPGPALQWNKLVEGVRQLKPGSK